MNPSITISLRRKAAFPTSAFLAESMADDPTGSICAALYLVILSYFMICWEFCQYFLPLLGYFYIVYARKFLSPVTFPHDFERSLDIDYLNCGFLKISPIKQQYCADILQIVPSFAVQSKKYFLNHISSFETALNAAYCCLK